jgi:GTPase KRas protein
MVIDGETHEMEILDTSSLDDYADLEDKWISSSDAFVLVYDISSRLSFKRISRYNCKVQRTIKPTRSPNSQIPMILVGNKCDKYAGREVSIKDGESLAQYLGCEFVKTLAKAFCDVAKATAKLRNGFRTRLER